MKKKNLVRFKSISESHEAFGLPKPQHPLISLIHFNEDNPFNTEMAPIYDVVDFYYQEQREVKIRAGLL